MAPFIFMNTDEKLRKQAGPYLRDGEELQQVFWGTVAPAGLKMRTFAVTDQRILVLGKKEGIVAELPRQTRLIPAQAGRFHLGSQDGGLSGLTSFTRVFNYGGGKTEKIAFGKVAFAALLAADGRAGENASMFRVRVLR